MIINYNKLSKILNSDPLWYLDSYISKVTTYLFKAAKDKKDKNFENQKEDFKNFIKELLLREEIIIGKREEYFNDDDRKTIDTAVIHHTSTEADVDIYYINATHLFTLYYPVYKGGFGKLNKNYLPISSGHFLNGKETFIGYHYVIFNNGDFVQTLKDKYVGFHAGDYKTNCKSIGLAFVDDLENKQPTIQALNSAKKIIEKYNIKNVLGHKEVLFKDKPVDTICPGNNWETWKKKLG